MDVSVVMEDVLNAAFEAIASETQSPDIPGDAVLEAPESQEVLETSEGTSSKEAVPGDASGETEKPVAGEGGELPSEVVVYVNQVYGMDEQLQIISDELSALSLNVDQRFEEQTAVLENQTLYLRDGNMANSIGLGLIIGFLVVSLFLKGRL